MQTNISISSLMVRIEEIMTKRTLCLIGLLAACTFAAAGQTPVPIEKEPMHRLKFENEFVRVFDVLIPAGKESLAHMHVYDGVGVRVSDAEMSETFADGTTTTFAARWGEAGYGSGPDFSHKVTNLGKTDFRNIYLELMPRKSPPATGELAPLTDSHVILIKNERVRVNRLTLRPGESSKLHTHRFNGLGIVVYDAKIEITSPGSDTRVIDAKAGDIAWQTAGTVHMIKNLGTKDLVLIDIEIL